MNHFPQLTPIENKLKQIYQQSLERSLQEPCDREDVMDVLLASYTITNDNNITKSLTTHIDEQTFILENMDISFVRHARYTPAFWHRHDFFEYYLCSKWNLYKLCSRSQYSYENR